MTRAEDREAIAEVCNTVEGITVSPQYSTVTKPGTGMVRWSGLIRDRVSGLNSWQIVLWLSTDFGAAERFVDTTVPLVLDALRDSEVLFPDLRVSPLSIVTPDGADVAAVVIEGTREEA